MQTVNVREARQRIGKLLDAVFSGEQVLIMRRGKPVAKLVKADETDADARRFPDRGEFRQKLPESNMTSESVVRAIRDERY